MSKKIKISAVLLLSAVALTGCASQPTNQTYAFDAVKVSQMPSWNKESVQTLEKEGWTFSVEKLAPDSAGVKNLPTVIYGFNKDETCTLEYNSGVDLPTNETLGDRFNTQSYIIKYIQSSMSKDTMTAKITESQIGVKDSSNKLAVSESRYDSPYYGNGSGNIDTSSIDGSGPQAVMPEQKGTIHNYLMARSLTANYIDNPMLELSKKSNMVSSTSPKIEPKGTTQVTVNYKCLNNALDEKVIETIKKDANITIK